MAEVFLDASYAIALASSQDQHHQRAVALARRVERERVRLVEPLYGLVLAAVGHRGPQVPMPHGTGDEVGLGDRFEAHRTEEVARHLEALYGRLEAGPLARPAQANAESPILHGPAFEREDSPVDRGHPARRVAPEVEVSAQLLGDRHRHGPLGLSRHEAQEASLPVDRFPAQPADVGRPHAGAHREFHGRALERARVYRLEEASHFVLGEHPGAAFVAWQPGDPPEHLLPVVPVDGPQQAEILADLHVGRDAPGALGAPVGAAPGAVAGHPGVVDRSPGRG